MIQKLSCIIIVTGSLASSVGAGTHPSLFGKLILDLPMPERFPFAEIGAARDFNNDGLVDYLMHYEYSSFTPGDTNAIWIVYALPGGGFELGPITDLPYQERDRNTLAIGQLDHDPELEIVAHVQNDFEYYVCDDGECDEWSDSRLSSHDFNSSNQHDPLIRLADLDEDGIDEIIFATDDGELFIRWSTLPDSEPLHEITSTLFRDEILLYPPEDYNNNGHTDLLVHEIERKRLIMIEGTGSANIGSIYTVQSIDPALTDSEVPLLHHLDDNPHYDVVQRGPAEDEITIYWDALSPNPTRTTFSLGQPLYPISVLPDLDQSGYPELIVSRERDDYSPTSSSASRYRYAPVMLYDFTHDSRELFTREIGLPTIGTLAYPAAPWPRPAVFPVDLDGDGDIEPLMTYGSEFAYASENRFPELRRDEYGAYARSIGSALLHVLPVDLDQDDNLEALIGRGGESNIVDIETGAVTTVPNSESAFMSVIADLEGDGIPEIVSTNQNGDYLRIYSVAGDGTLNLNAAYTFEGVTTLNGIVSGDFNNDGRDDLVVPFTMFNQVRIFFGATGPAIHFNTQITDPGFSNVVKPEVLDFNSDGFLDIAVGKLNENLIDMYAGDGEGGFALHHSIPCTYPYWLVAEDIDQDGATDLAVGQSNRGSSVLFLDHDGMLIQTQLLSEAGAYEVGVTDANNDGDLDILTTYRSSFSRGYSEVFLQKDDRAFSQGYPMNVTGGTGLQVADMNQDGMNDFIVVSDTDRMLNIYYGSESAPACPPDLNNDGELNFFDVNAFLTQQPDYNNDGQFNFFDVNAFLVEFSAGCP